MLLSLQKGILYGPVHSRRLGRSLGINLMPGRVKLCSFNCLYCHYGWTKIHRMDAGPWIDDMPEVQGVVEAVEEALRSPSKFDYLTFSGNGEPTLYPPFPELVDRLVEARDRYRPGVKLALLSNSTGLGRREVRESMGRIDFPFLKLDGGTEEKLREINRPAERIDFDGLMDSLASLKNIYIQTILVEGTTSNVTQADLSAYFQKIRAIRPKEVHLYSIDRPVPDQGISKVSTERLEAIAREGREETGIPMRVFSLD